MRRRILLLFCLLFLMQLAACGDRRQPQSSQVPEPTATAAPAASAAPSAPEAAEAPTSSPESGSPATGLANPFVDCATPEEAAALAGFPMAIPKGLRGYPERSIQAVSGSLIQVFYANGVIGEDTTDYVLLRKGLGQEDISGIYTVYSVEQTLQAEGAEVLARGEGVLIYVADWQRGDYRYSLFATGGLSAENVIEIAAAVQ